MAEYLYGEKIYEDEEKFFYDEMTKAHDFWASPNGKLEIAKMEKDLLTDGII